MRSFRREWRAAAKRQERDPLPLTLSLFEVLGFFTGFLHPIYRFATFIWYDKHYDRKGNRQKTDADYEEEINV